MTDQPLAVIVAHGSPSEPEDLDLAAKRLAERVQSHTPGWRVAGATLACEGSLEAAFDNPPEQGALVYPFFMSAGWFVKTQLRKKVGKATSSQVAYMTPFGLDSRVPRLCVEAASQALRQGGQAPENSSLLLAAHGSRSGHAAARAAGCVASLIRRISTFQEIRVGFVEESPTITQAAEGLGGSAAVCLPLFAMTAGHVLQDIPEQLAEAGFEGPILPPVGEHPAVARVIGEAIMGAMARQQCT